MARVEVMSFSGNPNIGLFGYCNDEFCLVGTAVKPEDCKKIEKILQVPVHRIRLAGTSLIGVFVAGNKNSILLPKIVFQDELQELDKIGINYILVDTKLTALGNNLLINDKGAIAGTDFEIRVLKKIEKELEIRTVTGKISGLENVGSLAKIQNSNCLISRGAAKQEIRMVEKILGVECTVGTMSMGLPYISSSILVNKNGMIASDQSTGIEISDAEEALGLR